MKLKVTQQELNESIANAIKRVITEKKSDYKFGFEKATKRANREIERDIKGDGFHSYGKVHKSPKDYSRKGKDKFVWNGEIDEERLDLTSPDDYNIYDDGYDTSEIEDIEDVVGGTIYDAYSAGDLEKVPTYTFITNIETSEQDLISNILNEFEDADSDVISGDVAFTIEKRRASSLASYLRDCDVEIKQKIKNF